jgi:hypothetical protein
MKKYTKITLTEQNLEDLIRQDAGMIEEGLVYLDHQKQTTTGRLDMLLADSGSALVVAELKVTQDDNMLMQGLDYFDYVTSHLETYARLYSTRNIDIHQQVRLLLVAPSFSQTLVNRAKWLNVSLSLFTYSAIQMEGERDPIVVFAEREVETLSPAQSERDAHVYTLEDHLGYATDLSVRDRIIKLMETAKHWTFGHISIDPIKHSLSFKVNGRWFAYLDVRRKHFLVGTYDEDEAYKDFPVKSDEDFSFVLHKLETAAQRTIA